MQDIITNFDYWSHVEGGMDKAIAWEGLPDLFFSSSAPLFLGDLFIVVFLAFVVFLPLILVFKLFKFLFLKR